MTNAEAIHVINQVRDVITKNPSWMEEATRVVNEAADMAIKALESQEWIPCNERLPDSKEYVLVTDYGETNMGRRFCGRWWLDRCGDKLKDVTAWMPLPEPYMEEEDDKR